MDDLDRLSEQTEQSRAESLARFLGFAGRLKSTPRTGWLDRGMAPESVESVADHSFRVAILAWIAAAADPRLDRNRVLILALIHDLAEAVTGDQTPYAAEQVTAIKSEQRQGFFNQRHIPNVDRTMAKRKAEAAAIYEMTSDLPESIRLEIAGLWHELEEKSTPEARFVKQADKLESYLQSLEYKSGHAELPVESFAAEVAAVIDVPVLVALRDTFQENS